MQNTGFWIVSVIYKTHNNRMHSDSKKRRSFLALLFAAGDAKRYVSEIIGSF